MSKKLLYKFYWDVGRMGEVESFFIADPNAVKKAIGRQVYFGEILGKHSEVEGELEEADFEAISDDQEFIAKFEKIIGETGYNPLDCLSEEEEDES